MEDFVKSNFESAYPDPDKILGAMQRTVQALNDRMAYKSNVKIKGSILSNPKPTVGKAGNPYLA